jgi:hypothetical protein
MTTRIPSASVRPTGGALVVDPQSKDDALLHTWFPDLGEEARDLFSAQWSKTGLPLSGNYVEAQKLYDQLFRKRATPGKTSVRPRSLSATLNSGSGREPKSLSGRAVHVPSASTQAPAPPPQKYPEISPEIISIDLTDFLAASVIEVKTEETPAPLEAKDAMGPEDEELCKELDKALEDWTPRFNEPAKPRSRQFPTPGFHEEFTAHCKKLRQIYKKRLKGAENQNALLRKHITTHLSDLLSVWSGPLGVDKLRLSN